MPKSAASRIRWLTAGKDHANPAAQSCLRIIHPDATVRTMVARLRNAPTVNTGSAQSTGPMKTR